mmetsp:Transcript_4334/g.9363  ORF Transcript_4334/g.9363 Transcript_4334/m.9363 type:complete len:360 (+) Transcript_4334:461-1540(+)|eukprot:CAMPEP_0168202952 /NCGR_PEP_ID=MMETSP0139_2-20121125/24586_1 /TAXON_ID=44445 /ORGANISM="Pseudo-nitzschia australis, Strain 10249 10 AB" /LENGTH=359 /DNA_ID=CAMNT_0008128753 /DNA_START=403 /DNA_END=1482 /DNA_ORIENTATION=-
MATLVVPTFQTKSKRHLFIEDDHDDGGEGLAEVQVPNEPIIESEISDKEHPINDGSKKDFKIVIVTEEDDKYSSTNDNINQEITIVSNLDSSPLNAKPITAETPRTAICKDGSPTKGKGSGRAAGGSFFTRLFGKMSGNNNKRRPTMKAKGVYFDSKTCDVTKQSDRTLAIGEDGEPEYVQDWIASNLEGHHREVPVVVRRPEYDAFNEADDRKLLKKIMMKARKLPQEPGKYASNHIMVNAERTQRNVPPLRRERHMDKIAREQAKLMAEERKLFHLETPRELEKELREKDADSNELPIFSRLGMNNGKGKTIAEIHRFMMAALAERNNIQDKRFSSMGMGTHQDKNGILYLCQIFGG